MQRLWEAIPSKAEARGSREERRGFLMSAEVQISYAVSWHCVIAVGDCEGKVRWQVVLCGVCALCPIRISTQHDDVE